MFKLFKGQSGEKVITKIAENISDARAAINFLQGYANYGDNNRHKFLASLNTPNVDYEKFLRIAVREKSFDGALKIIKGQPLKETLRGILDFTIESKAKQESKLQVISALIEAERDLISGVSPDLILANFVRRCVA